jgi:inhibitor of KinA
MYEEPRFLPAGDQALVVELGEEIDPETNRRVHDLARVIDENAVAGVVDLIPTYRSLLVQYDPLATSYRALNDEVVQLLGNLAELARPDPNTVEVPTLYGGESGPDLEFVAEHAGLNTEEVVATHSGTEYLVYMMGFTPGFPYLGGLPERLHTRRLETPRSEIPAGSVGIAEGQTGVYPVASPGGWRLIGRTPLVLFDPRRDPPSIISAGDRVRFVPLSGEDEYNRVREQGVEESRADGSSTP